MSKRTTTKKSSSSPLLLSDPQCSYCGRSLAGYTWTSYDEDGNPEDGYICTATHPELGGDVAFFKFKLVDDAWTLTLRE